MSLEELAAIAVMREVCPDVEEFVRRLPSRPDWQARITERVQEYEEARQI